MKRKFKLFGKTQNLIVDSRNVITICMTMPFTFTILLP